MPPKRTARRNPIGRGYRPETQQSDGTPLYDVGQGVQQANSLHGSFPDPAVPAAKEIQEGARIARLPDVAYQPEGGTGVFKRVPQTLCPTGFTGTNDFTTIIDYDIPRGNKLILVDAWVGFTNAFVAEITTAVIFNQTAAIPLRPRIQDECLIGPGLRAAIRGVSNIQFKIQREDLANGWDYGFFEAFIRGWLVPDQLDADMIGWK